MADTSIQVSITVSLRKVCISVPKQYRTAERIHTVQDVYLQKDFKYLYILLVSPRTLCIFDTLFDSTLFEYSCVWIFLPKKIVINTASIFPSTKRWQQYQIESIWICIVQIHTIWGLTVPILNTIQNKSYSSGLCKRLAFK